MIPGAFVQVAEMPLTANGKIDRQQLKSNLSLRPQLDVPYVAPKTPLQGKLAKIWSEVLGVDQVGLHDNFFDLGGDSFSAYRLMMKVSDEVGRELALESIFRVQTVAALAEEVEKEEEQRDDSSLVPIQIGQPNKLPFFCVHQAGGDVVSFQALAKALGEERPFYGVQATRRAMGLDNSHTLEEMAAEYLKDIVAVQPHGPYLIAGHSMGGKVAYEMARQLEQRGEEVALLAIFDTDIERRESLMVDSLIMLSDTFHLNISREELEQHDEAQMLDYVLNRTKKKFTRFLELAYEMDILPRGFRTRDAEVFMARIAQNVRTSDAFQPKPILKTPVTLFLALEQSYEIDQAAWRRMAQGGLEVVYVSGTHLKLIQQPHVRTLAAKLIEMIDAVEQARLTSLPDTRSR